MFQVGLKLPIKYHTDETLQSKELGIDYDEEETATSHITFYHIDAVAPYRTDKDSDWCTIHANNSEYACPLNEDEVNKIIEEHIAKGGKGEHLKLNLDAIPKKDISGLY